MTTPRDLDVLFVPGGTTGTIDVMRSEQTMAWVKGRATRARNITSVCTGSMILARAGLLIPIANRSTDVALPERRNSNRLCR